MKTIKELKNPDVITVNGKKFQVIENITSWYYVDKDELEMAVELVEFGTKSITPNHRLTYFEKNLEKIKFFALEKKGFEEVKIDSYEF